MHELEAMASEQVIIAAAMDELAMEDQRGTANGLQAEYVLMEWAAPTSRWDTRRAQWAAGSQLRQREEVL